MQFLRKSDLMEIVPSKYSGVFWVKNGKQQLATLNLAPGFSVYGEKLIQYKGKEYRIWDPYRSKIAAAIMNGIKDVPIKDGMSVLYLGAANGTTASHVADIVGRNGKVFCIDIAPRAMRDLIYVCEHKPNMVPILADANKPDDYEFIVSKCDFLFEDVASPDQVQILIKNAQKFLKENCFAMIAIKARSIDVTKKPQEIFNKTEEELKNYFEIIDKKRLEPYEADHMMFLLKKVSV